MKKPGHARPPGTPRRKMTQTAMPFARREPHDAHVMVHFTQAQLQSLRAFANSKQMTVGACVRMMLVTYLNSNLRDQK